MEYEKLSPDSKEIRLAELFPRTYRAATGRRHASCRLLNVSFENDTSPPEPYTALSYTWGDSSKTSALYVNNVLVRIQENLSEALPYLEQGESPTMIWADAICIDQDNALEKSQQVAMMAEIFQRASQVLVWLGPGDDGSQDSFDVLRQLGEAMLRLMVRKQDVRPYGKAEASIRLVDRSVLDALIVEWCREGKLRFNVDSAQRVLQRPWFRRVWVLQEVALNDNVTFHCGPDAISKQVLWAGSCAMTTLVNECYARDEASRSSELAKANFIARRTLDFATQAKTHSYDLAPLLMDITSNLGECQYQATDPRDRIFAVLGFLSDSAASTIHSDYTKTCAEVYIETAEAIMRVAQTLDIMYTISGPKNVKPLPSWVPDWSVGVCSAFGPRNVGRSAAAGHLSRAHPLLTSDEAGRKLLMLTGYNFDTVSAIMDIQWDPHWETDFCQNDRALGFIEALRNFGRDHRTAYVSEAARAEALWKTPIADCDTFFDVLSKIRPSASSRMRMSFESFIGVDTWENDERRKLESAAYINVMNLQSAKRRIFLTSKGHYGLGQETLHRGDRILLLLGGDSPFIAREVELLGYYEIVGEAYVHGIMEAEHLETHPHVERFVFL